MKEEKFKYVLGEIVRDAITGFEGVVVVQSRYLTGCNRYGLQNRELKDGKPAEWQYFDEDMIVPTGRNIEVNIRQTGGPVKMEAPAR